MASFLVITAALVVIASIASAAMRKTAASVPIWIDAIHKWQFGDSFTARYEKNARLHNRHYGKHDMGKWASDVELCNAIASGSNRTWALCSFVFLTMFGWLFWYKLV